MDLLQLETGSWQVRVGDELDEQLLRQVVAFVQRFTPEGADPVWSADYFRWKLGDGNPAGRGWLTCAVSGDEVVGLTTVTPKRLWIDGAVVAGAEIGDTYTHPAFLRQRPDARERGAGRRPRSLEDRKSAYVSRSIFGRLVTETRARAEASGVGVIYGTPNHLSRPGYEKWLDFTRHPTHRNSRFVRPTARGLVSRYRWLRPAAWALSRTERALSALSRRQAMRQRSYVFGRLEQPSGALDELWDRLKGQRLFSMVRDQAYVRHRFFEHPLARYEIHTAAHQGRLCGILVTRVMSVSRGKRYGYVADWLVDAAHEPLFPRLLAQALCAQQPADLDGIQLWCGSSDAERFALRRLGFVRVDESPVILFQNEPGRAVASRCPALDFTLASSDNI